MIDLPDGETRPASEGTCRARHCICLSQPQKIQAWPYVGSVCPMWQRLDEAVEIEARKPFLQRILGLVR